ncbi:MAG: hypothetical protein JWQ43_1902 [Glaciihabitans sp.]|nr:hypothetical protein [Glaciihabitans sp.]
MSGLGALFGNTDDEQELRCSRAGCSNPAAATVNWRNPKIHSEDRVKVWLACNDHIDYLRDYVATRNFPVTVADIGNDVTRVQDGILDLRSSSISFGFLE